MNSHGIFMMLLARPRNPFAASNWQLLRLATVHGIVALGAIEKLVQSGQFFDLRRKITGK